MVSMFCLLQCVCAYVAECTAVNNAESNATYICTAANDTDVSGCADGFGEDETGMADICTGSTASPMGVRKQQFTCFEAFILFYHF